ncbi:MAG: transglutaminaseTgpA domain-containing protein [Bdellovibrionota bacterium]
MVLSNNAENYVLLFCFLLTLVFNLNAAQLFFLTVNTSESNSNISISFFFHFIKVFPIGAVAGALIFFLFPRVPNVGEWFGVKGHASKTGYTGRVSLTGGREISESDDLVFRVQAKDKSFFKSVSVNEILFKGNILDFFDGKTWTGSKGKGYHYAAFRGKKTAKRSSNDL